jgi:hypothetical protein
MVQGRLKKEKNPVMVAWGGTDATKVERRLEKLLLLLQDYARKRLTLRSSVINGGFPTFGVFHARNP